MTSTQVLSCNYCKIVKNSSFYRTSLVAASENKTPYKRYHLGDCLDIGMTNNKRDKTYSKPYKTSKMECFAKMVNGF